MSFTLIDAKPRQTKAGKHDRNKLDLATQEYRVGWKRMLEIAFEITGKREGFTITECKRIIERMRREIK